MNVVLHQYKGSKLKLTIASDINCQPVYLPTQHERRIAVSSFAYEVFESDDHWRFNYFKCTVYSTIAAENTVSRRLTVDSVRTTPWTQRTHLLCWTMDVTTVVCSIFVVLQELEVIWCTVQTQRCLQIWFSTSKKAEIWSCCNCCLRACWRFRQRSAKNQIYCELFRW